MRDLPAEQRDLLRMAYFDDKPHSAIAEASGLPLGTVKSRHSRARAKLRDCFAPGEGRWVEYDILHAESGQVLPKQSWVWPLDERRVIGCGIYRQVAAMV